MPLLPDLKDRLTRTLCLRYWRQFEAQARQAAHVNADTLRELLHRNRDTDFGLRHGFSSLRTVADYQRAVPISTYEDFRLAAERIARGEQRVLCADRVEYLGITSGTTGQRKLIPVTRATLRQIQRVGLIARGAMFTQLPDCPAAPAMVLLSARLSERSEAGLPVGGISAITAHHLGHLSALPFSSPLEAYRLSSHMLGLYVHLLFGLRERELGYLYAPLSSGLLDALRLLEQRWPELVEDMGRGLLRPELELPPEQRRALQSRLRPAPQRARELEQVLRQGMHGVVRRLWPRLGCVMTVTGSNFSLYERQLAPYLEGLPVHPSLYICTEAALGMALGTGPAHYCLLPGSAFFEFIPEQELEAPSPRTLLPEELEQGGRYELVLTTRAGLYRYRLGDVVQLVGRHHQAPLVEFLYRRGSMLSLAGEKTSEDAVRQALGEALAAEGRRAADYTVVEDIAALPARYVLFIELQGAAASELERARLAQGLDESLCHANSAYECVRRGQRLGALELHLVQGGTFQALREALVQRGASPQQVKVPRVLRNPELESLLHARRLGSQPRQIA